MVGFKMISMVGYSQKWFANLHVFQPDFTHRFQPDFNSWFQHDFSGWIQPKIVCKIYMYFKQISPIEFNLISTLVSTGFYRWDSTKKLLAKSTCISTRFLCWIQTDFKVACLLVKQLSSELCHLKF